MVERSAEENPKDSSMTEDKVVMHLLNGRLLKGVLLNFVPSDPSVRIRLNPDSDLMEVSLEEVKAIFYVKTFSGDKDYREKRKFGLDRSSGRRIMVRFKDGEILVGRTEGQAPRTSGSLEALLSGSNKGFEIFPADPKSNNTKVFVLAAALVDARYL
jgi:hypothetical protein